jgi:hypothetical protein
MVMGVNTPASTVVIVGLRHPLDQPYTVAEYKNMVGRAGRLGFTERGRSIIVAPDFRQEHEAWNEYVTARPEDLQSRFLDADPRGLILRVLATSGQVAGSPKMTAAGLVSLLEAASAPSSSVSAEVPCAGPSRRSPDMSPSSPATG